MQPYLFSTLSAGRGKRGWSMCVCRYMCSNTLSQCLEHNNSSSSWRTGKLLLWARPQKERKTVWNDSKETKREKSTKSDNEIFCSRLLCRSQIVPDVHQRLRCAQHAWTDVVPSYCFSVSNTRPISAAGLFFLLISPCWWCSSVALGPLLELTMWQCSHIQQPFMVAEESKNRACCTIFLLAWFDLGNKTTLSVGKGHSNLWAPTYISS